MNSLSIRRPCLWSRWFRPATVAALLAGGALFSTTTAPAQAGGVHVYAGGRSFGRGFFGGLGFGLGVGITRSFFYSPPTYYYSQPNVIYYPAAPTVYYVPQASTPPVTIVTPPAAPASTPVPSVPAPAATSGKASKILYDANGKPVGVLVLNSDGTQEFVPLAQ